MNETKYAYAVARIRSNENSLLTEADMNTLLSVKGFSDAIAFLNDRGVVNETQSEDVHKLLSDKLIEAWKLICEIAPDISLLDSLIIKNDINNLKAALKCVFKNLPPEKYFIRPCVNDPQLIYEAISKKEFEKLPEYMREVTADCYELLTIAQDGQAVDMRIDKCGMDEEIKLAKSSGSEFLLKYMETDVACTDIKIAMRGMKTGKTRDFFKTALSCTSEFNINDLISAALSGEDDFFDFLTETKKYAGLADAIRISYSAFEKKCDDMLMEMILFAKHKPFGLEPLASYYLAKEAEIKNIRIILFGKLNNVSDDILTERVRLLYV